MKDLTAGIKIAVLLICLFMLYLTGITFLTLPEMGGEYAKTILPYFLSLIGVLIGYYWGNSSKGEKPLSEGTVIKETSTVTSSTEGEIK